MQCIVTGGNVKVLAKAIHSLSRIGDTLYVEPQKDGLALRSVNSSRSAYACFLFAPLFFSRYSIPTGLNFHCKMAIKSVQAVFRSLAKLEKTVEKCHIELDEQKDRLTFTLHCKYGLLKTHNLSYQDSESLQAVFDKDSCANVFRAQPRVLVDTVAHFPPSLEEVTVTVTDERMWVRNHVEDEAELSKAMLTELCLASDEFDQFAVKVHNSITFCLKELRGLLLFAEPIGLPISMYFNEPGSPVVLSVTDSVLEGDFVLATLSDDSNLHKNNSRGAQTQTPPPLDDFMNDDMDSYLIAMDTSMAPGPSTADPSPPSLSASTSLKQTTTAASHRTRTHRGGEDEEEEEVEEDPDRPPDKKFRSLFFGSVLPPSSQMSTQPVTTQEVLASDSEDDTEAE
ncbi:cell cycle checkpoint control protein RAD9A [Melanotaenia boesemani]|uniref:cell cycle checkpoint control protein RAD9A n=1 Tax=Melanotaenia boesemani TaxID=1250792 RepID=UPI001C0566C8|nr:cell cycle checkpoint control protein RAD9A [Melanotaenia boesemani]